MRSTLLLALNPSIDVEWLVENVLWEEKNDVRSERRWAGGKGINVARWLKHLGGNPQLILPLGGKAGSELAGFLRDERIPARIIRLREATRANVIVTTASRRQMRFNAPGPKLSRREWESVLKVVESRLARTELLILSGSLPRGVPRTAYAQLIKCAHRFGVKTLLDCDGPAFAAAIKSRPFLVKPNEHELAQWWGRELRGEAKLVSAAGALSKQTGSWVLVSRGAKRSLLVNRRKGFREFTKPPRAKPRNTVGAGDAMLAAVARQIACGAPPRDWLRQGTVVGTAATQCLPGRLPSY